MRKAKLVWCHMAMNKYFFFDNRKLIFDSLNDISATSVYFFTHLVASSCTSSVMCANRLLFILICT